MEPVRGCYYASWAVHRAEPYKFTPEQIPLGLCTHIFYAFAAINSTTFEARMRNQRVDEGLRGYEKFVGLKQKKPELKTLLSFGGWTESQTGIYATMASDTFKRDTFVRTAWALANKYGFDGIDLDWEYPHAANKENYVALIRALKEAGNGKLVTTAVSASGKTITEGYDVPALASLLDYMSVMTYSFRGTHQTIISHPGNFSQTRGALAFFAEQGMPKQKILMGVAVYGRGWIAETCEPGAQAQGKSPAGPVTKNEGIATYFELMNMNGTVVGSADGPFLAATINAQKVCYGFDDVHAIHKKMQHVKDQGYGGAFSWTIDFDQKNGFPIHTAIRDGLAN